MIHNNILVVLLLLNIGLTITVLVLRNRKEQDLPDFIYGENYVNPSYSGLVYTGGSMALTPPGAFTGQYCLSLRSGKLYTWTNSTWSVVTPVPSSYIYLDLGSGKSYQVNVGKPPTLT
jgi:hypothetical protein